MDQPQGGDDPFDIGVDGSYGRDPVAPASWFQEGLYVFFSEVKDMVLKEF